MATLYKVPTQNSLQYTLDQQLAQGGTSLTLNQSVAGIVQSPGVFVIDRVDSSGNRTSSAREYVSFTGVSGAQLTGLTRGLAGSSDQVHSVGAIVEFVPDIVQEQAKYDVFTTQHDANGAHTAIMASSATVAILSAKLLTISSLASAQRYEMNELIVASQASIGYLNIGTQFSASGASILGVFPSSSSGSVLTSNHPFPPVYAPGGGSGTGGFNALFQVPGGLASQANIGGLIPVPIGYSAQFVQFFVQTPASAASVSIVLRKNMNTIFAIGGIAAGATYGSSASISSAALAAGDVLTMDINSTASLAADLSVMLRAQ